ncbi:hypothetical protein BpHYR1_038544 [Brachionus plicatilis]|uniref:Uncharacterized protein n=1 Tax=Brachionus plicatilis TaxID=10195 RepID=A0A3M7SNJ5_BRAPC|nr:hypothetical protein BpHYR1_038544 [Brachionus plicatilis]
MLTPPFSKSWLNTGPRSKIFKKIEIAKKEQIAKNMLHYVADQLNWTLKQILTKNLIEIGGEYGSYSKKRIIFVLNSASIVCVRIPQGP